MKIYKGIKMSGQKLQKVVCNQCGATVKDLDFGNYLTVKHDWGYGSSQDNTQIEFDLCESCVNALTKKFKHPVSKQEIFP